MCAQSCPTLCDPWTAACHPLLSMGFPRQEYWSGLLCPTPGALTRVSCAFCFGRWILYHFATWESLLLNSCITLNRLLTHSDWFQIGKRLHQGCMLSPCLFNLYAEYIMQNAHLNEVQVGEISITSDMQMTPPLWQKAKNKERLDENVSGE